MHGDRKGQVSNVTELLGELEIFLHILWKNKISLSNSTYPIGLLCFVLSAQVPAKSQNPHRKNTSIFPPEGWGEGRGAPAVWIHVLAPILVVFTSISIY